MLSIIVAVHNQLAMNQLFWEHLSQNTEGEWELIIVDNLSTDGSREFFQSVGATVIENPGNYSYPYCQNRGIEKAKGDVLAFLNNDVVVPKGWNTRMTASMAHNGLDILTSCGVERVENKARTKKLKRRWQWIKGLIALCFGKSKFSLALMHRWMYPNWPAFYSQRMSDFKSKTLEGFVGNTVMMSRRAIELIGPWDERIQAADFDLFLRTKTRARDHGDIKPVCIALDVFVHHYIRLTLGDGYPPFVDKDRLINLEDKWSADDLLLLDSMRDDAKPA